MSEQYDGKEKQMTDAYTTGQPPAPQPTTDMPPAPAYQPATPPQPAATPAPTPSAAAPYPMPPAYQSTASQYGYAQQPQPAAQYGYTGTQGQNPAYTQQSTTLPWTGLGIAGFVCSIASLFIIGIILAPLGLVLSILGYRQTSQGTHRGHGLALAGIIIGGICTAIAVIDLIVGFSAIATLL